MRLSVRSGLSLLRPLRPLRSPALPQLRRLSSSSKDVQQTTEAKADGEVVVAEPLINKKGEVVKTWGSTVELPAVTKQEAEAAFLQATDLKTAMTPPVATAVAARDDMLKDRFNYVSKHVNSNQYIVAGGKAVAPAAISQGSFIIAGFIVVLAGIGGAVYIKTQWKVNSALELGDRLRERGAARKEALERSTSTALVRRASQQAETSVKENVELVRRPSQQLGEHFDKSFKGVVKEGRTGGAGVAATAAAAAEAA